MSLSFFLTSLIVIVSPGTGVLYTLAAALTKGSRASIAAAFGCTLGIVPYAGGHARPCRGAAHQRVGVRGAEMVRGDVSAVHGLAGVARARCAGGRHAARCPLEPAGDRHRFPDQHPQPETLDLLPGVPAAVHRRGPGPRAASDAGIARRIH